MTRTPTYVNAKTTYHFRLSASGFLHQYTCEPVIDGQQFDRDCLMQFHEHVQALGAEIEDAVIEKRTVLAWHEAEARFLWVGTHWPDRSTTLGTHWSNDGGSARLNVPSTDDKKNERERRERIRLAFEQMQRILDELRKDMDR